MSERKPFQPKGELPEWRILFDVLLARSDFGDVITYSQLDNALGRSFRNNRGPIYRANRHLGETRLRCLEAVPGQGYRVVAANEHDRMALDRKKQARRRLRWAGDVLRFTDRGALTQEELERHNGLARHVGMLYQVVAHHENRLQRIEDALRSEGILA